MRGEEKVKIIRTNFKFKEKLQKRIKTDLIVLHHADATNATVEDIHRWHLQRGWAGIGYHFYVRKDGSVYEGRPIDTIGAHVQGFNARSIGICAEGNYDKEKTMPEPQKQAIIELVRYVLSKYPNCRIVRHKDLMATSCPGRYYPFDDIKREVMKK